MGAVLLALALAATSAPPLDVHVSAADASGKPAPEVAGAVARALIATGATVILGPGARERCGARCVEVFVQGETATRYRIEARQRKHLAASSLDVPAKATLFDAARAIAVEARLLLISWTPGEELEERPAPFARARPAPLPAPAPAPPASGPMSPPQAQRSVQAPAVPLQPPSLAPPAVLAAPPMPIPSFTRAPTRAPTWAWVSVGVGSAAAVGSGVFALLARDRYLGLTERTAAPLEAARYRDQGERFQTTSLALGAIAVAALSVGLVELWFDRRPSGPVTFTAAPLPQGGAAAGFAGSLP